MASSHITALVQTCPPDGPVHTLTVTPGRVGCCRAGREHHCLAVGVCDSCRQLVREEGEGCSGEHSVAGKPQERPLLHFWGSLWAHIQAGRAAFLPEAAGGGQKAEPAGHGAPSSGRHRSPRPGPCLQLRSQHAGHVPVFLRPVSPVADRLTQGTLPLWVLSVSPEPQALWVTSQLQVRVPWGRCPARNSSASSHAQKPGHAPPPAPTWSTGW